MLRNVESNKPNIQIDLIWFRTRILRKSKFLSPLKYALQTLTAFAWHCGCVSGLNLCYCKGVYVRVYASVHIEKYDLEKLMLERQREIEKQK